MPNPAEGYESYMVPALFAPWAVRLLEAARPEPGERVLDVGCGTGIVARRVAALLGSGATVVGLDASAPMLGVARAAAGREGVAVEWLEGRAEALPFADASFDLLLCQFALMFFADPAAALAGMRRVVAAHGRVVASVWQGLEQHPFYRTLDAAIEQRTGIAALRDIFALGERERLAALFGAAGFRRVIVQPLSMTARFPDPPAFLAGEIEVDTAAIPSMQHLDAAARREIVAAVEADMAGPLAAATQGGHVVIDFHAHIVCAQP